MKLLDAKTSADAVKLVIFMVVTSLATGVLVATIGNLSFAATKEYQATTSGSPVSGSATSRRSRSTTGTSRW